MLVVSLHPPDLMSRTKWILLIAAAVLLLIQLIRPSFANPPVDPRHTIQTYTQVPPNVDALLRHSCYDCHSSETRWPWYAQMAPVSWWLTDHVDEGRRELSFSEFATYTKRKAARKLQESCEQVEKDEMPLKVYVPMHPAAKLSDADRKTLCAWFRSEQARIVASMTPAERAAKPPARRGS